MQTSIDENRTKLLTKMREHLEGCISPTAHRGYTWEQWKTLAETAAEIDWQCDFDAQGKCKTARVAPCKDPPLGHVVGNNDRNCCFYCSANKGFLEKVPKDAVPRILALYDPRLGFWVADEGCVLPWKWRSHVCLGYSCRSASESLATFVGEVCSVTATSPWWPSLNDKQIAELIKELRRDGMFNPSPRRQQAAIVKSSAEGDSPRFNDLPILTVRRAG